MSAPVFEAVAGQAFDAPPAVLQDFHSQTGPHHWSGRASAKSAQNPVAKLVAKCVGLNLKTGDWPLEVHVTPDDKGEIWERRFGPHIFKSRFAGGTGKNERLITEQFGIAIIGLAVVIKDGKMHLIPRRTSVLGISVPKFLLPREDSYEYEDNGKFHFNVNVRLPFIGHIDHYHGVLTKVPSVSSANQVQNAA